MVKAVNPVGWNAIMVRIIRHHHRRHAVVTTEDGDNRVSRKRVNKAFAVMPASVPASVFLTALYN